jgi:hypothetical protein
MTATLITCPHCGIEIECHGAGRFACSACGGHVHLEGEVAQRTTGKLRAKRGWGWWSFLRLAAWLFFLGPCFLLYLGMIASAVMGNGLGHDVGIIALLTAIPATIGAVMERVASRARMDWICEACGNRVHKHARLCPTCRAAL